MRTFGQFKTYIENSLINSYGKKDFKNNFKYFKTNILESKELSEIFYLYDNLSSPQSINEEVANEFLIECINTLKVKIEENKNIIESIISNIDYRENNYTDIDNMVYISSPDKILEKIESKNRIKSLIISEIKKSDLNNTVNIPLTSMSKIAAKTFVNKYSDLNESDVNKIKKYLTLSKDNLSKEFYLIKDKVITSLNEQFENAGEDKELKEKITETINKIENTKPNLYSFYQLEQLSVNL